MKFCRNLQYIGRFSSNDKFVHQILIYKGKTLFNVLLLKEFYLIKFN